MNSLPLVFALALAYHSNGVTAEAHIKAAVTAYNQARAATAENHFAAAIESFRKTIEIEPTFEEAHEGLIKACLDSGQQLEAAAVITRFLEIEPNASRYRLVLGQILLELKQPERALAQFSFILKADPFNPDALLGFATAANQAGLPDRAAEAMERGRARYPTDNRFKNTPRLKNPN
ncbi:MAG: tetratricopeptide repeat protein [Bryobacteraceae bacterium]